MSSWNEIVRGFFNIPKYPTTDEEHRPNESHIHDNIDEDDDGHYHDQQDFFGNNPGFNFTFRFTEPDEMFKHFEEIFKDLGMADFPPMDRGSTDGGINGIGMSPRDRMLKDRSESVCPDCGPVPGDLVPPTLPTPPTPPHRGGLFDRPSIFGGLWRSPHWDRVRPQDRVDTELDGSDRTVMDEIISGAGASKDEDGSVITRRPHPGGPGAPSMFHGQSVAVRTVRKADGSTESIRTVQTSDGKEETTVTRTDPDGLSHTITTSTSPSGQDHDDRPGTMVPPRFEHTDEETRNIFKELFGFSLPGFGRT